MPVKTYALKIDTQQTANTKEMMNFALTVVSKDKTIYAKSILKKLEHGEKHLTLGRVELWLTAKEKNVLDLFLEVFKTVDIEPRLITDK